MKNEFAKIIQKIAVKDLQLIFLTGDLGFNAFESLRETIKDRFINAGVAEQNMLDVAAGMAYAGLNPWTYSIAPFLILKSAEQIRNDICQRNLSVKLVGNGGGFGYGIMGSTHHLLEDISILSSFPNIQLFIPAYLSDIAPIVKKMNSLKRPSYLRLGASSLISKTYSPFRNVAQGKRVTVVVLGPLLQNAMHSLEKLGDQVDLWVVTEIPFKTPQGFYESVQRTKKLMIVEEHVLHGGLGQMVASDLGKRGVNARVIHLFSKGYPSKLYGSHKFHLQDNGLDHKNIYKNIRNLING